MCHVEDLIHVKGNSGTKADIWPEAAPLSFIEQIGKSLDSPKVFHLLVDQSNMMDQV